MVKDNFFFFWDNRGTSHPKPLGLSVGTQTLGCWPCPQQLAPDKPEYLISGRIWTQDLTYPSIRPNQLAHPDGLYMVKYNAVSCLCACTYIKLWNRLMLSEGCPRIRLFKSVPVETRSILQEGFTTRDHPIEANDPPEKWCHCIHWFTPFGDTEPSIIKSGAV